MEEQYKKYQQIVKKITKDNDKADDLLHDVLIQLGKNEKYNNLPIKEQTYFFVRAIQNQFYSNNSAFQRTYQKYKFVEFDDKFETNDEPYYEAPTMEWLNETLELELKNNPDFWYDYGIFKMYLQYKQISRIHTKTKIPKYSLRKTIKELKLWARQKWIDYQNGTN